MNKELANIKKGKVNEETQAEMARLAEIRRRREEAAKDKEDELRKVEEARVKLEQAKKEIAAKKK